MITIDGSFKSGSGTIVRDAVLFSALTGEALRLTNIRAKRPKPGLRAQHLTGIEAAARICQGELTGATLGSPEIRFRPGPAIGGGAFDWNIGTAGSTTMLALGLMPLSLFAAKPSRHTITGGLFQDFAPSAYHVHSVLFKILALMGIQVHFNIIQPGYVPKGQGRIEATIQPLKGRIRPLTLVDPGRATLVQGIALASLLKDRRVAERMAGSCRLRLESKGYASDIAIYNDQAHQPVYSRPSIQPGAALAIWTETDSGCILGADMAGARGRSAEQIGQRVARRLIEILATEATVDEHAADQLIPFCALAEGWSTYIIPQMTDHIEARLWLVEKMLGATTEVDGRRIRIKGIGYRR
jgi:RNA 3'-terminal phosphate cyclase (ATP)